MDTFATFCSNAKLQRACEKLGIKVYILSQRRNALIMYPIDMCNRTNKIVPFLNISYIFSGKLEELEIA